MKTKKEDGVKDEKGWPNYAGGGGAQQWYSFTTPTKVPSKGGVVIYFAAWLESEATGE